jgi:hypothetical protein
VSRVELRPPEKIAFVGAERHAGSGIELCEPERAGVDVCAGPIWQIEKVVGFLRFQVLLERVLE